LTAYYQEVTAFELFNSSLSRLSYKHNLQASIFRIKNFSSASYAIRVSLPSKSNAVIKRFVAQRYPLQGGNGESKKAIKKGTLKRTLVVAAKARRRNGRSDGIRTSQGRKTNAEISPI